MAAQHGLLPHLAGVILLLAVLLLVLPSSRRRTALVLGILVLASFLFLHLPIVVKADRWGADWTHAFKALALSGACFALVAWDRGPPVLRSVSPDAPAADGAHPSPVSGRLGTAASWAARSFLAAFLVVAGIQHFLWAPFVATLVPSWIPAAAFWTYFTGVALIAGGAGLLFRVSRRMAALAVGAMIFSWVVLLHAPRVFSDPANANELTSLAEALAFGGTAWLLSGRRHPASA